MLKFLHCLLIIIVASFTSCNSCNQTKSVTNEDTKSGHEEVENRKVLYVFINPNGEPCKQQIKILNTIQEQIKKHANILYIKTTEPFDKQSFYDYGIRSLPSMIFVDEKGSALHRFPPGIQSAEKIMSLFEGS